MGCIDLIMNMIIFMLESLQQKQHHQQQQKGTNCGTAEIVSQPSMVECMNLFQQYN